jgi:hypothetical protein
MIFVAGGIWMLFEPNQVLSRLDADERWMARILPWVAILFFGWVAWMAGRAALDRRPQIVLTPSGFYWRKWSQVEIPWTEIVEIEVKRKSRARYIALTLRDRSRYRADNVFVRFYWINGIRGLGDLAILVGGLNRSTEEILVAMERFRDAAARP